MKQGRKKSGDSFELEVVGGMLGGVILILALAGILDYRQAPVFFTVAIGFGIVLNGLLCVLCLWKKNYILGALFGAITLAMLILFSFQIMMIKG